MLREESWRTFHHRHSTREFRNRHNGPTYAGDRPPPGTEIHRTPRKSGGLSGCLSALTARCFFLPGGRRKRSANTGGDGGDYGSPTERCGLNNRPISFYNDSMGDMGYNFDD